MPKKVDPKMIREILRLKLELNLHHRTISSIVGVSSSTVSFYSTPFIKKKFEWCDLNTMTDHELEKIYFPHKSVDLKNTFIEPDFKKIYEELRVKTVTLQLLWEEYRAQYQERAYGRTQFFKLYRTWRKKLKTTMIQTHKAGDKLFIDYAGSTVPVIDSTTGEIRRAQIFVAVMGASSYTFAEATWTQRLPDFIGSQVRAFAFYGGVTALIVPDNLKSCSTKACRYEPVINQSYTEMLSHYHTTVLPARPRKPQDKSKAELGVQLVGRWILAKLRHQKFFTLFDLNQALSTLLIELNAKPFQKLPGSRLSVFEAVDKPALKPLPDKPYEYAEFKKAQLGFDYHIEVEGHYYSAPYECIHESLDVRITQHTIECFFKNKRVASHIRSYKQGEHTTVKEHMPLRHQKHSEWHPERFFEWAKSIGQKTLYLTKHLIETKTHPEQGYRACLGLLTLLKKYGKERLEAACHRAIYYRTLTRRSVAEILKGNLDKQSLPEADTHPINTHHKNIRGPNYFVSKSKEIKHADTTNH